MKIHDVEVERVSTRYGRFYIARDDSVIGRSLKLYGEWAENEINGYSAFLTDGGTIIDVGANIGTHSIALASRFPHAKIYAFEPQPLAFSLLAANILAARKGNIYAYNLGCSDQERLMRVAPDYTSIEWNIGAFSLRDAQELNEGFPLRLVTLDSIGLQQPVQFIKVDVEGMEKEVLAGAEKIIARDRPLIFFELLEIGRLAPIQALLKSLDYELRWFQSEAFNPRNFRMNPENIWKHGEVGVLALPSANNPRAASLTLVSSGEVKIPSLRLNC